MEFWMTPQLAVQSIKDVKGVVVTVDLLMEDLARYGEDDWGTEPKWDGFRMIIWRRRDDIKVYAGRNGSDYTGHLPVLEAALTRALPPDTCIDCEIVAKAGTRGNVQSIMFTNGAYEGDDLCLVIFDVLRLTGNDTRALPWHQRRHLVEMLRVDDDRLKISPLIPTEPESLRAAVNAGFEGVMLKHRNTKYVNGRSSSWVKFKPQRSTEAKVIGFKAGKAGGSLDGMVGAFEVELLDNGAKTTVKCGSMDIHQDATDHPENWLGLTVEIKYFALGDDGVPLSPQFLRRRDDLMTDQPVADPIIPEPTGSTQPVTDNSSLPQASPSVPSADKPRHAKGDSSQASSDAIKEPLKPARPPRVASGPRPRNYKAMGDAKLARSIRELRGQDGEAYEKVTGRGGDPDIDLAVASEEARLRGLEVGT